jgi:hypothetical protein
MAASPPPSQPDNQRPPGTYASLLSRPSSKEAALLIGVISEMVIEYEQSAGLRKKRRSTEEAKSLKLTIGALLGDLLRAMASARAEDTIYRSLKAETFSGDSVPYRTFVAVVEALEGMTLIEKHTGKQRVTRNLFDPEGKPFATGGTATRFKATQNLKDIYAEAGIRPEQVTAHFRQQLPAYPITLKAASKRVGGEKIRGSQMRFERTSRTDQLSEEVKNINAFLDQFTLEPCLFSGFKRGFNEGDTPNFDWNKGGRLYCQGSYNYQLEKSRSRLEMTIDGEPVVEVDVRASYLTVLHGVLRKPFNPQQDPYQLDGIPRPLAKDWTVATLGSLKHLSRWPARLSDKYFDDHGVKPSKIAAVWQVRAAMETRHPILKDWGQLSVTWADLMFYESEAMLGAMERLRTMGIPSYPVFDALIVRQRDQEQAMWALKSSYKDTVGIQPELGIKKKLDE